MAGDIEGPYAAPSAVDRAVSAIRDGIRSGRYGPGQRLVENDVMAELGVGRNALREAFARLRSDGFVTIEPFRGASVRRLTRRDVAQLYDLREALEGLASRLAAERLHEARNRERLIEATAVMKEVAAAGDLARYMDENLLFHRTIVDLSGHPRLVELVEQLHIQTFRVQFRQVLAATLPQMRDHSVAEHDEVVEAILDGDGAAAEERMRFHLRHMRADVMKLPDSDFG